MMRTGIAANHGWFELELQPTAALADSFEESQIFRIRHYQRKVTVQGILASRFPMPAVVRRDHDGNATLWLAKPHSNNFRRCRLEVVGPRSTHAGRGEVDPRLVGRPPGR